MHERSVLCWFAQHKFIDDGMQYPFLVALDEQSGNQADCAEAVEDFNKAAPLFGSLPPKYTPQAEIYKNIQAVSFVALYNPKDDPKLECGYFNCTETTPSAKTLQQTNGESQPSQESTKMMKALLCLTSPQPLVENEYPFDFQPAGGFAAFIATRGQGCRFENHAIRLAPFTKCVCSKTPMHHAYFGSAAVAGMEYILEKLMFIDMQHLKGNECRLEAVPGGVKDLAGMMHRCLLALRLHGRKIC
ncbi:hypothetical protein Efla_004273 [Eimeria flavescens]